MSSRPIRRPGPRERDRERRPVLGRSRRRRQLRRRHVVHVPGPSARAGRVRRHVRLRARIDGPTRSAAGSRGRSAGVPDAMTSIATFMTPPPEFELGDDPVMLLGLDLGVAGSRGGRAGRSTALREAAPPDDELIQPTTVGGVAVRGGRALPEGRPGVLEEHVVRPARRRDDRDHRPPRRGADLARDRLRHPSHGRRLRARAGGRHAVPGSVGAVLAEHLRVLAGRRGRRRADRVRPGLRGRDGAARVRRAVRELPRAGRRIGDAAGGRRGGLRSRRSWPGSWRSSAGTTPTTSSG